MIWGLVEEIICGFTLVEEITFRLDLGLTTVEVV
jgi:hypothetical protein